MTMKNSNKNFCKGELPDHLFVWVWIRYLNEDEEEEDDYVKYFLKTSWDENW